MLETILFLLYGAVVLLFGITLTAAFAGLHISKRNSLIFLGLYVFSGGLQLAVTLAYSESLVWKIYPLITHLPLILVLFFVYRKTLVTALSTTFTAYLFCQPSKWAGVLAYQFTNSQTAEALTRILCLFLVGYVATFHVASCLSDIFNKDRRSVIIFGIVPTVYYAFDYFTAVYTNLWVSSNRVVAEFLPFFLAVTYIIFCFVYYKEYEQKAEALRKEQFVRITVEQQAKEMTAVRQVQQEIRLIRHDMRMLLSSLAVSIENGELENAQKLIAAHVDHIDGTRLQRFCSNDSVNYVLSDYSAKCAALQIPFICVVELEELSVDDVSFASILSNGLDNALNAQKLLPSEKRYVKLMIKNSGGKLLVSLKNPVEKIPVFADGLPVAERRGHGYGTQSIRYLTERLGGNCQFSVQDHVFILRVVL